MTKITTDIIEKVTLTKSVKVDNDIVLLKSDSYRGLFSVGEDNKLYAYNETSGSGTQFSRRVVYENCSQFAASRIDHTDYFAMALISGEDVKACVTDKPEIVSEQDFTTLDFSEVLKGRKLLPDDIFINTSDKEVSMAITMRNETGRIEQFIAYFTVDRPTYYKYFSLAASFDSLTDSFCGRAPEQSIDGIYSLGSYASSSQLLYTPITNVFSTDPPSPIRLAVPDTGLERIGLCRLKYTIGTHLFGIGGKTLYFYPYDRQHDCGHITYSNYDKVAESDYFLDPVKICSYIDNMTDKLYVWVLNKGGRLSYTFAKAEPDGSYSSFVEPILFRDHIFYFDADVSTLTMCTDKNLLFGSRNSDSGYVFNTVAIETDTGEYSVTKTFATKITTDKPGASVRLTSVNPIEAYINNIYYRFTDITVTSDGLGVIDIVQAADSFSPEPFNITVLSEDIAEEKIEYFAGKSYCDKMLKLTTPQNLKAQKIIDKRGNKTDLTKGLSDKQIDMAAKTISQLAENINILNARNVQLGIFAQDADENDIFDDLGYALSEAWDYLCDKAEKFWNETLGKAISFVTKIVSDTIHFIIKIGDEIITFVLSTVGKVLKCVVKVLEFIGIPIDKILDWLLSFLDIDGAVRAKEAMKYCMEKGFECLKDSFETSKEFIADELDKLISQIDKWANIDTSFVEPYPEKGFSLDMNSSNMFMFDSIFKQGDFLSMSLPVSQPPAEVMELMYKLEDIISLHDLSDLEKELLAIIDDIENNSGNLQGFIEVLKKVLGFAAVKCCELAKDICGLLFEIILVLTDWFWEIVNTKIHIPLVSAIFEFFGIEDFSILDVICIVPSFFINLIYRAVKGESLVSEEMLEEIKNLDFTVYSDYIVSMKGELNLGKSDTWDNAHYNLEKMSKTKLPTGLKQRSAECLHLLMCGAYAYDTVVRCIVIFTPAEDEDSGYIVDMYDIAITVVLFGLSMACGYGCYGPMDYDSDFPTEFFNKIWFVNSALAIVADGCSLLTKIKKIFKIPALVVAGLAVFGNTAALVMEAWSAYNANQLDLSQDKIEYNGKPYYMNPTVLDKDRKIFICDVIGYCFNSAGTIIDGIMSFDWVRKKISIKVKIGMCVFRGIIGAGSTTTHLASSIMIED